MGVLALLCAVGNAQAQHQLLTEALIGARQNDARYLAALSESRAAQELRVLGAAAMAPEVTASVQVSRNLLDQRIASTSRDSAYMSNSAALQLRKPLYAPELALRAPLGEERASQAEAVRAQREIELMLRLVDAYTQVVAVKAQAEATDALITGLQQQLRSATRQYQLGEGTRTEQLEAESRLELAHAQGAELATALADARRRLALIAGPAAQSSPPPPAPRVDALPSDARDLPQWERLATSDSPVVRSRRHALQAARHEAESAQAASRPRLDFVASLARGQSDSVNTLNQSNLQRSLGLSLSVPLYDGGRIDAGQRQAWARVQQAEAELEDAIGQAVADVRQYFDQVNSTSARARALTAARRSAIAQVEATRQSVRGGIRVTLDVLNAESQRYDVERDLVRARIEHLRAWARLRAAAGQLGDADFAALDRAFAPGSP